MEETKCAGQTQQSVEEQLAELLLAKGWTMGTAESCTGGSIAARITARPGSSAYFKGAVVSYCNEVKQHLLGVSEGDLLEYGAVSQPVVEQMALGAIRVLDCDCAVATSGIAGPTGGSVEKPVGTVWIAAAVGIQVVSAVYYFSGDRERNIHQSVDAALSMLLQFLS